MLHVQPQPGSSVPERQWFATTHWSTHDGSEHLEAAYSYNSYHLPLTYTNALGEVTTYTYTGNKISTIETPSGLLSTYTYNGTSGFAEKIVDSAGGTPFRTNLYSWSNGLLDKHTNELGLVLEYTYDDLNRLTRIDYPDSSYIEHRYTNGLGDSIIEVGASRDRLGNWTYFGYNSLRQLTQVVDPLGRVTKYEYCSCGSPEYVKQAYGTSIEHVTHSVFDYQGHLTHVFKPGGINLTNTYDQLGRLITVSDSLGSTTNQFDNLGRLTTSSNYAGLLYRAYYDDHNLVRTNIDANGVQTIRTYDDLHRLRTRAVSGSGTESFGYTADISGPTSYTNQLGKVTTFAYHAAGWKTNEVIVGMATNKFTYDAAGNLRTLSDGKSQLTSWGYDTYGRVTSKTNDSNTLILSYLYDASNRLTNRWSAAKGNTAYGYDATGNLTNINYPSSTDITYAYDSLNRMTSMADAIGTTTWTYDLTNRFSVEDGPWSSDNVTNRWNTAGLRESMAIQQPASYFNTSYTWDAAKRLSSLTSGAGAYTYYYHPGLNSHTASTRLVHRLSLPNTSFITNYFDSAGRLTDTYLRTSASVDLNRHSYVYNNANQRTKQTLTDGSYYDYLYDDAGQLYSSLGFTSGGTPIASHNRGYTYDPVWNMTARTNNTTISPYTVNNLNQVTNNTSRTLTFDDNGNLTYEETGATTYRDFVYDDENQLSQIINYSSGNPSTKSEFDYDGKMRLRINRSYSYLSSVWTLTGETRYVYDGMLAVQDRDGSNIPTVTYTRGTDLSGTFQGAGGIGGLLARSHGYSIGTGSWSTHNHYHADGNGNITYLVNPSQGLYALYRYDPFGNVLFASGSWIVNLYRFSSKLAHTPSPSSLYYYGYRFYNPNLQRWLNADPLQERGGLNLYRFAKNEPVSHSDPTGLFVEKALPIVAPPPVCVPVLIAVGVVVMVCDVALPGPPPMNRPIKPSAPISCNAPRPKPGLQPLPGPIPPPPKNQQTEECTLKSEDADGCHYNCPSGIRWAPKGPLGCPDVINLPLGDIPREE